MHISAHLSMHEIVTIMSEKKLEKVFYSAKQSHSLTLQHRRGLSCTMSGIM